jgi:multiple sugar transport system permease protein
MTRRERGNFLTGIAFISPWIIGFAVFTAVPIGLSLYYSFCDYALTAPSRAPLWIGLDNYRQMLHDDLFWKSLGNTLYYAAMAVPAGLVVSLGLALLLDRPVRGQAVYRALVFLPALVPGIGAAVIWLWMFESRLGLINFLLSKIGITGPNWLGEELAMPSLALMSLWSVGNTVVIFLAGLQETPRELLEAAQIDGAGPLRRLASVILPALAPVIFFNLVIGIIGAFSILTVPFIMTQGGPNNATYFYTMYSYDQAFHFLHMGYAAALAWVQLVVILALTGVAFWIASKWVQYG